MSPLRSNVLAAKERLAAGFEALRQQHEAGVGGRAVCHAASDLRDAVILVLFKEALTDIDPGGELADRLALVAHGGYGRREVAPFSDVDLMILRAAPAAEVFPLAERMLRDVFDAGMTLGQSVRSTGEACRQAVEDALIGNSLVDSRLLAGSRALFDDYLARFRRTFRRQGGRLLAEIETARVQERLRYGETAFLLEPNLKRSEGGLRDVQFVRWIGLARYGTADLEALFRLGVLSANERAALERALEFLLELRNELHFHAGRAADVLDRTEQLRITRKRGMAAAEGLLPVERFMREFFRHTSQVSHVAERFLTRSRLHSWGRRMAAFLLGHPIEGGYRIGPAGVWASPEGLAQLSGSLTRVLEVAALAALYDRPLHAAVWDRVAEVAAGLGVELNQAARRHFWTILGYPPRLGELLRGLHRTEILEKVIPEFAHARGLLQFNQYHKYTVDEHCLRTVEELIRLGDDEGPLGRVYRRIESKALLHLAALIHDLGKGYPDDHSERGAEIARRTAERMQLSSHDAATLVFLVRRHLLMNHRALRRDTSDAKLPVEFAVTVGSPERLQMLYVLTAADLMAVGPGTWSSWKGELITELFHHTMRQLTGESPGTDRQQWLAERRGALLAAVGRDEDREWVEALAAALPASYLQATEPAQVAADLALLKGLAAGEVAARSRYLPETGTVQLAVGTTEDVAEGIFHRLTGALTAQGLVILSAEINTLPERLVLDRFRVVDPDYEGPPPAERLERIERALRDALRAPPGATPAFRRTWQRTGRTAYRPATRVETDNTTSDQATILDVFTLDRPGLLYAVSRTLFEEGLSVWRAKIGSYLDQVVDVFYVTDRNSGRKIEDPPRLEALRRRLVEVIDGLAP